MQSTDKKFIEYVKKELAKPEPEISDIPYEFQNTFTPATVLKNYEGRMWRLKSPFLVKQVKSSEN